jgi:hypothetical protein
VTISRAVPNIRSERPAETRDYFVDVLGFEVAMDMGWVVHRRTVGRGDDLARTARGHDP